MVFPVGSLYFSEGRQYIIIILATHTAHPRVTSGMEGSRDLSVSQRKKGSVVEISMFTGRVEMFFMTKGW